MKKGMAIKITNGLKEKISNSLLEERKRKEKIEIINKKRKRENISKS
jgi:hypothetical protein